MQSLRALRRQIVDARHALVICAMLAGALAVAQLQDAVDATRWYGLFLQIAGLVAVIVGLKRLRNHFQKPSLLTLAREWFSRWRDVFGHPTNIVISPTAVSASTSFGRPTVRVSAAPDATVEQQLAVVRHDIDALFRECNNLWNHHEELSSKLSSGLKEERRLWEAAITGVRSHHEQASIGDFGMEITGVVFVLVGVVLATVPDWIGPHLQRIGNAIVNAVIGVVAVLD